MPPDDSDTETARCSRRSLLRAGGGALALSASSAGCVATLPPLGRRIRYGRVDAPEPNPPSYRRWLPAPSAFQDPDSGVDLTALMTFSQGRLGADVLGEDFDFPVSTTRSMIDHVGVGFERYERVVWNGPTFAVEADVDRSVVRDTLDATGYRPAGTHRGYDLYSRDDTPRALAVGEEGFAFVFGAVGDAETVVVADAEAVVDAATGVEPRYHETDETFRLLSDAAGGGPFTSFNEGGGDEAYLASGTSFAFDGDGVYYVSNRVYPEGERPTKAEIQRELEDGSFGPGRLDPRNATDVDVEVDGRIATIEQRKSHDWFRESNQEKVLPPQITWGIDHDRHAETVTLTHEAGESVPADRLSVTYSPVVHDGTEPEIGSQFVDEYDVVDPGDSLTVDVSNHPGDDYPVDPALLVGWRAGEATSVLLSYEVDR